MRRSTNHRRYRERNTTPFLDLLMNGLLSIFLLLAISFLMIQIEKQRNGDIKTKAEYIITITWQDGSKDDVDVWLEDPLGNVLFFRNKEIPMANLDRDDRGERNDMFRLPNGDPVLYEHNQETVTIRGFIPGEWTLNVHMYDKEDENPANVEIKMEKLNPSVQTVLYKKITMTRRWEEITVARFKMENNGVILSWNTLYKKLAKDKKEIYR